MTRIRRFTALIILTLVYRTSIIVSKIGRQFRQPVRKQNQRVIVCVTIDNPNWFRAHIKPLVAAGYGEVVIVCDEPLEEMEGLTYACPPNWLSRLISRAGGKFYCTLRESLRKPTDLIMGYHIFPCAVISLIAARLSGSSAAYQATSGNAELAGGGFSGENALFRMLGKASKLIEDLVHRLISEFDLVLVRGSSIKRYIRDAGYQGRLEIITGSIITSEPDSEINRDIDLIFVGRLTEVKQLETLLQATALVLQQTDITLSIVGDGPDRANLEAQVVNLGMSQQVSFLGQRDDVYSLLCRSKIFALTSRTESVSIAMLEAMSRGAVPIVTNVGDLTDFVEQGVTGFTIPVGDKDDLASKILELIRDPTKMAKMSDESRRKVDGRCSVEAIATFWNSTLTTLNTESS